jgi:hypothetical protein
MTVVWWVQGADRERALTALPAATPSRAEIALDVAAGGERDRPGLRRSADVAVVEAADVGQGNHAAELGWLDSARLGCILLEREMRPRAVVVAKVAAQTATEMSLAQDDHVVEKLTAEGADDSFGEGVLPRGAW